MKTMTKTIKVGVVGCGYWGPNLIRNFRQAADCQLAVLCDTNEQRLRHMRRLYPEVATTSRFEDLLEDPTIDAIIIATPVRLHHEMGKACLNAGKHTFIEKPMTRTVAEGEELVALAQQQGVMLMVGHTFLFSPAVRKIKEIILSGDVGEIRYISARRLNLGLFQKDINVAWDLAPHDISIILELMDEFPIRINCQGNAHITPGIEDVTSMSLTFPNNRFATIQNSWLDPRKVREMTIVGSKRMVVYDDVASLEKLRVYDSRVDVPPHYDTFAEFQYAYHYGDMYVPYLKQEEPLKIDCQHFLDCIRNGKTPLSNGRKGLELVKILEAASASLKRNGAAIEIAEEGSTRLGTDDGSKTRAVRKPEMLRA